MVFCIAGHVDHGKTTLVKALTGVDTDRLPEERKRNMTIDLGFAPLKGENGNQVSLIDLPGHERFTSNLLCGTSGCKGAILCVDLGEGIKPQTIEHLQIFSLLKIKTLICVLTKKDLVNETIINQRREELNALINEYGYDDTPLFIVSAKTGEDFLELKNFLTSLPKEESLKDGDWFLPIDRVWISKEKGVIITGTLQGGGLKIKDKGLLMPKKEEAWVKGLEQYGEKKDFAKPFTRVAIMLGKREGKDLRRGNIFCKSGVLESSDCLDGEVTWLKVPKHASRIRVSIGTEDMGGKVILIPNQEKIVQLRLDKKIGLKKNMTFVIRSEESRELLGGGKVLITNAIKRRTLDREIGKGRDLSEDILNLLQQTALPGELLRRRVGATLQEFSGAIEILKNTEQVLGFADLWYALNIFEEESNVFLNALNQFHQENHSTVWVKREEILKKTDLTWKGDVLDQMIRHLKNRGQIKVKGTEIASPSFIPQLSVKQQTLLGKVKSELEKKGLETPYPTIIAQNLEIPLQALEGILKIGREIEEIVLLPQGIYYTKNQFESILKILQRMDKEGFSLAEFKQIIGTSRKYALAILEHLDNSGITIRFGDKRKTKNPTL